jgi:hypothetical protein
MTGGGRGALLYIFGSMSTERYGGGAGQARGDKSSPVSWARWRQRLDLVRWRSDELQWPAVGPTAQGGTEA